MDFGKYIHELLLENEIVIVPGFGAFVSEYKPAEISEDSDEIKPPSKVVTFNQQIRNNDGLLVGYVAEKKRSSHFDALKKIEKEREDILYKLDSGEDVELAEVGTLFYTEENKIGFKAKEDENLLLDSFGLEATSIAGTEDLEEEPLDSPVVEEEKTEELDSEPEVVEKIAQSVVEEEEKVVDEKVEELAPIPIPKPDPKPEIKPLVAERAPKEQKKKRGWLWLLLILVPLIAVSVFIFMKDKKDGTSDIEKGIEVKTTKVEDPIVMSQSDTIKTDTIQIVEKDTVNPEEIEPEAVVEPDPDTPKYYLVGGSFSVEENAETYLKELKDKGFDAFHVGKKGRFFIVGIGTYDSFREAEKAKQDYMSNNSGSEVWVWKK